MTTETKLISISVLVNSVPQKLWEALTIPQWMVKWMAEPGMELEINTDWKVGSPIIIKGFHHVKFENRGVVLAFEPERKLSYTHLSSVSPLPDKPENHVLLEFALVPNENRTRLTLALSNFPDEIIRKHMELYWRATLELIREFVESKS